MAVPVAALGVAVAESDVAPPKPLLGKEFEAGAFPHRQGHLLAGLEHRNGLGKLDVEESLTVHFRDLITDLESRDFGETVKLHRLHEDAWQFRGSLDDAAAKTRATDPRNEDFGFDRLVEAGTAANGVRSVGTAAARIRLHHFPSDGIPFIVFNRDHSDAFNLEQDGGPRLEQCQDLLVDEVVDGIAIDADNLVADPESSMVRF
uniref:Uncharacterized protein n=1 Tax=Ixodes ricinus TaxID=34613 RepID=A0A6B0V214_IXORI